MSRLIGENADLIGEVSLQAKHLLGFDGLVAFVFFGALAAEDLDVDHGAFDAGRAIKRSVADVSGLLAEDGAQQLFLRGKRRFALGRDFADQDIARPDRRADTNDAAFIQVSKERFADVGNVARDLLGTELGVARFDFELFDVNGGVVILFDQLLADQDGVLEVVPAPGQEGDENVAAQRELASIGAGAVREDLSLADAIADPHQRLLVDAGILVGALELDERVDVRPDFAAQHAGMVRFHAHDDPFGVHLIDDSLAAADDHGSRIASRDAFHAGAHQRSFTADQRHGLALHVGTHQGAVGVVIFEERYQARGNGHELFGRNVDVIDLFTLLQHEVAGLAAIDQFGGDLAAIVQRNVGLSDDVAVFFPSREIEAVRLGGYPAALELLIHRVHFVAFDDLAGLEFTVAGVDHLGEIDHAAALDLAVGRFDKSEFVDARITGERADQADVRTFRRFDGADPAVVSGMDVAHFKPGAFARKAAGAQGRQAALVRDFAERIGLIHELRQLRAAEEFANRGHNRFRVHQVVRHSRGHFLINGHLFLDGALHADQTDAELVLQELADRADAAIAKMIDVVHRADILAQLEQVPDGGHEIGGIEGACFERRFQTQLDIELQPADFAEVVLARIEEHAVEKRRGGFERRRIAGTQLAIDFDERFARRANGVLIERARDDHARIVAVGEENIDAR